jgi:hypothetical protein
MRCPSASTTPASTRFSTTVRNSASAVTTLPHRLQPVRTATITRVGNDEVSITDGPFADTKNGPLKELTFGDPQSTALSSDRGCS